MKGPAHERRTISAANKTLLRRFYKEVHADWNMALADELLSPGFVSHDWPAGGPVGPAVFPERDHNTRWPKLLTES
ncbi:MAG: ester cyclase [Ottowia sp.]|nr:ester cyclase [Ottowia sp.]